MRVRLLAAVLCLAVAAPPVWSAPRAAAESRIVTLSTAELMQATALDKIFDQLGPAIAASARSGEISADTIFLRHWEAAAASAFNSGLLRSRLAAALDGKLSDDERQVLGDFFRSGFGLRISALEREATALDADGQAAALEAGGLLSDAAGAMRSVQLDELMQLTSAEVSVRMAGQSMRALLLGLALSQQHGDIEVPWRDIDAQVAAMMPDLVAEHSRAQRAMMAYAYRDLSDEELERYIAFLRTEPAQKLFGLAAYSVGQIAARSMARFGETLATRLASVNI